MQCACAILSSVACPALQFFFPPVLIKGNIFGGKKLLSTKRVFSYSLQRVSEIFLILRINEPGIIKYIYFFIYRSSCKVPFILVGF